MLDPKDPKNPYGIPKGSNVVPFWVWAKRVAGWSFEFGFMI